MARIALSVSSDYLPSWGPYEGLREMVQNFIDSQDDSGIKGEIRFEGGSARGTVRLVNPGAKPLTREALLFGVTSKADRADQRGQFGEGMKVGTLALVRAGRSVTIRTQEETWSASLQSSDAFGGRKVLTFDTRKRSRSRGADQVEVEIGPVTREEWDKISSSFLFMQEVESSKSHSGCVLTGADHLSLIFAKGILVKKIEGMRYGYDLSQITLNRDRSMIDEYDVRAHIVSVLSEQYRSGKIGMDTLIGMFRDNTWETQYGYAWQYSDVTEEMIKALVSASGPKPVITDSNEEAAKIESFGWDAIRVTKPMMEAMNTYVKSEYYAKFRKSIGLSTYKEFLEMISCAVSDRFDIGSLTDSEGETLSWAIATLASVGIKVDPIVCRFARDGELLGLYSGGEIFIARSVLACKHDTLGVLIHEYSHNFGGDASLEHTASIESVWVKVSRKILG